MVFETALMLSVANPGDIFIMGGLCIGSFMFFFSKWNSDEGFYQYFSLEAWKSLVNTLLRFMNNNEEVFHELRGTISETCQIIEKQSIEKLSGQLQNAFETMEHEMEEVQKFLMHLEKNMTKRSNN